MMSNVAPAPEPSRPIVWSPLPGSQAQAVSCPCHHILYEGTRGPGKTDCQLFAFRKEVGKGYGRFWRGVIFDREYKNLDDLVNKALRWFPQFFDGAVWLKSTKDYKWIWPTGEELLFRVLEHDNDYWKYHGQEFTFIGWNELTKFPTCKLYDDIMSCNRSSFIPAEHTPKNKDGSYATPDGKPLPEIPLVVFSTTNPYGAGHNWVKKRFIDRAKPGQIVRVVTNVFNPRTQKREDITKTQVRIFGSYKENRYLSPVYIAEIEKVKEKNKRRAWLWGDWDIVAGGALDDLWDETIHIIKRFPIPKEWRVDRSFDWGSTKPFSCGWWAEANGEEVVLPNGKTWCPPRGSLIRIHEYYGCDEENIGNNEGIKMGAPDVARNIKKREADLLLAKWIVRPPAPGPADNAIRNVVEKDSESIEVKMDREGIRWTSSDKKPGSRKNGLQLMRDRLESSLKFAKGEEKPGPGLFFMEHCRATLSTLPVLPRDPNDPDDVDTEAEDHAYDDVRYRVLAGSIRGATNLTVTHPS